MEKSRCLIYYLLVFQISFIAFFMSVDFTIYLHEKVLTEMCYFCQTADILTWTKRDNKML